ncbi:hypothetical protein GPECTOR_86g386 [Gonium pectorale]|uniref:Beta-lactamase-related domain-containing protein n=1 Tax=Gonium pectorale TaxID=33097 RepID=A0A150G160_GONPE|nr:hypothetical protein GPECTOR_86g386 [Gonium pectorale]|eukprot:KXZ43592.1 hypothetical protein GPECTOR_86g386 [Gonium pectorale]
MDFARPDDVESVLHLEVYRGLQDNKVEGAAVCVVKAGRHPFSLANCYGFQDVSRGSILDPCTSLWDLGGCARLLAAAALLRLLQEGDVPLAADINSLLPRQLRVDTSRYGTVTVQHLLLHTSGLQRREGGGGDGGGDGEGDGSPGSALVGDEDEAVPLLDTPVTAYLVAAAAYGAKPPGAYRPQELDYMLIGAIIEHMVGEPYDQYVRDVLLEPLGVRMPPPPPALAPLPAEQRQPQPAAVTVGGADAGAGGGMHTAGAGPLVWVYRHEEQKAPPLQQDPQPGVQLEPSAAGLVAHRGGGSGGGAGDWEAANGRPPPPPKRVLCCYNAPPLTPVGGLVLPAADAGRLLQLFVRSTAVAPTEGGAGAGGEDGSGDEDAPLSHALLSALCEVRVSDFTKDVGVAYGGLVSLGLAHTGDGVLVLESPLAPPSVRELALIAGRTGAGPAQVSQPEQAQQALQEQQQGAQAAPEQAPQPPLQPATASQQGGGGGRGCSDGCEVEVQLGAGPNGPTALLILAPHSGAAALVACNTAAPQGAAFCRKVATALLERFRPAELPRPAARSWLTSLPPPRQDPVAALVAFPPAACTAPVGLFEGWPALLPDYLRVYCMQAPGHGLRRDEACLLRLAKMVPPAADAIAAGVSADTPLALFGHGLGSLWAFEVARRLECLHGRPLLHLFVCGCAGPPCFPSRAKGVSYAGGGGEERYDPWQTPEAGKAAEAQRPQPHESQGRALPLDAPELFELPDDALVTALRNHPRVSPQLRSDVKALVDHLALLRADIEAEMSYSFAAPAPALLASVAAVLASVQNRADEEARLMSGSLSCPITVLIPEDDEALTREQTAAWEEGT